MYIEKEHFNNHLFCIPIFCLISLNFEQELKIEVLYNLIFIPI